MAKGPSYTEDEQKLLNALAKKGGNLSELAAEFIGQSGSSRSEAAVQQKIRKLMLDREAGKAARKAAASSATESSSEAPKRRGRPPKVNTAPLSDAPPAKKRGRPAKTVATTATISAATAPSNGNGSITVDLGEGLLLVGPKKRVGEMLQQIA